MEATINPTNNLRIWASGALALLLSIACTFCYFGYMGQGIAIGDMIGLPGREADIALAQHRANYWLMACLFCFTTSIVTGTVVFPFPFYRDASRLSRMVARFMLASILSLALTVFVGVVAFSVLTALHRHFRIDLNFRPQSVRFLAS
jgi:hypothetical protein